MPIRPRATWAVSTLGRREQRGQASAGAGSIGAPAHLPTSRPMTTRIDPPLGPDKLLLGLSPLRITPSGGWFSDKILRLPTEVGSLY
jgi:hypothetical protein